MDQTVEGGVSGGCQICTCTLFNSPGLGVVEVSDGVGDGGGWMVVRYVDCYFVAPDLVWVELVMYSAC